MHAIRVRRSGQALIELALVIPLLTGLLVVLTQYAILYMDYVAVVDLTRDTARWIAANPDSDDATVQAHIANSLPRPLVASGFSYDFSSPSTNNWPWYPNCPTAPCSARVSGAPQRVALTYDVNAAGHLFLHGVASFVFVNAQNPTALPRYPFFVDVEQR